MKKLGYEVSDWTFTGMPDNRSAFITLAARQQPATATPPIPMPAPETPVE
jgi:hypothetical protein